MASNSTGQAASATQQAYNKFLDDVIGPLPKIDSFGDLDNEVHPIFRRENFLKKIAEDPEPACEFVSEAAYIAILLALRLASMLITQSSMCHVLDHIANNIVTKDENATSYMAKGPWEGSALGYEYIQAVYGFMASNICITFAPDFSQVEAKLRHGTALASTWRVDELPSEVSNDTEWLSLNDLRVVRLKDEHGKQCERHVFTCKDVIRFQSFFLEYFENGVQQDTSRGKISALFFFVRILMHEVTHAFGHHVESILARPPMSLEHRWSIENPMQEFGWAYDAWFFQGTPPRDAAMFRKLLDTGTIFLIDALVLAPIFVPIAKPNAIVPALSPTGVDHVLRAVDMRKWFLKSTWQDIEAGNDSHAAIMKLARCTETGLKYPYLLAFVRGKEVARLGVKALRNEGWFAGWPYGSLLGEGFWDATSSQEF